MFVSGRFCLAGHFAGADGHRTGMADLADSRALVPWRSRANALLLEDRTQETEARAAMPASLRRRGIRAALASQALAVPMQRARTGTKSR